MSHKLWLIQYPWRFDGNDLENATSALCNKEMVAACEDEYATKIITNMKSKFKDDDELMKWADDIFKQVSFYNEKEIHAQKL